MKDLMEIGKFLLTIVGVIQKSTEDRKKSIAAYYENISNCLGNIVTNWENGKESHKEYAELESYYNNFSITINDFVEKEELDKLETRLKNTLHSRQMLYAKVSGDTYKEERIHLSEASGIFIAMAGNIKGTIGK